MPSIIELEQALVGDGERSQKQACSLLLSHGGKTTSEAPPGDPMLGPAADSCVGRGSPGLALSPCALLSLALLRWPRSCVAAAQDRPQHDTEPLSHAARAQLSAGMVAQLGQEHGEFAWAQILP